MNPKQLTFQSQKLVVDYISFNIQGLIDPKPIANYLFQNFGFNYTIEKKSNGKRESQSSNSARQNQFKVSFRQYEYNPEAKSFWLGTKIDFSGKNATRFYQLIQQQKINWNILQLSNLSISRFDVCYFREKRLTDQKGQLESFFSNIITKLSKKYKKNNLNYDRSTRGYILRIGNRKSSNFYRIYQTKNGLKFELEIKKKQVQQLSNLLFCYNIQQFEEILTKHFYTHSKKVLIFDDCYTDWLIKYFRKNHKPISSLVTSYLKEKKINELSENETIFTLLQFLAFSRSKNYNQVQIYDQIYYLIEFTLKEYIQFSGIKNINQYQRNKFINLFYSFQKTEPFITYFTDLHFQSILGFPYVNIQKQANSWVVKVAMSKLLYDYDYPFSFPNTFLTYQNIYDLHIKVKVIQAISTVPLEKVFYVEVLLEQFNVSTSKKSTIKKHIVKIFNQLQMLGIIKNNYKLIKKSQQIEQVDKLTHLLLGQTNRIYFYENLEDRLDI